MKIKTVNVTSANSPRVYTEDMGVTMLSYKMSSGSSDAGTVLGSVADSVPIDLEPNDGNVFISAPNSPIQLTLAVTQGTLKIYEGYGG